LDWNQWQSILKRLQAISDHVSSNGSLRPSAPPARVPQPQPQHMPRRQAHPSAVAHR
jgi:hypothetical protein